MIERGHEVVIGSLKLRLPTPEDMIILKAVAHRPKDLADIQAIAVSHPDFDKERIKFWVEQFDEALKYDFLVIVSETVLSLTGFGFCQGSIPANGNAWVSKTFNTGPV